MSEVKPHLSVYSLLQTQLPSFDAKRLFHGRGGLTLGFEQINIEVYPPVLWVMIYQDIDESPLMDLLSMLVDKMEVFSIEAIYIQRRYMPSNPVEVFSGADSYLDKDLVVEEQGLRYQVNLGRNQNTGLFLDMLNGRQWVRENSDNKKVLNLFSYTCSLGLAAAVGGAKSVVNLDMSKSVIKRGQQNFALNDINPNGMVFIAQDVFKMIKKLTQKGPFDLLICDPPSFQGKSFDVKKDYEKVLIKIAPALAKNAQLMLCLNSPALSQAFILDIVTRAIPQARFIQRLANPDVLADSTEEASLKVMLFQLE